MDALVGCETTSERSSINSFQHSQMSDCSSKFLPGGICSIDIQPTPKWPIELRNARALHGLITAACGGHRTHAHAFRTPTFSLLLESASPSGWAVWFGSDECARLASTTFEGELFHKPVSVKFGNLFRMHKPRHEGPQRLRITTITPVVIQSSDRKIKRTEPDSLSIESTLRMRLSTALGMAWPESLRASVTWHQTAPVTIPTGGKFGDVTGWFGGVDVDCDGTAAWLLKAAARGPGLGGRTGLGFGKIDVKNV